MGHFALRAVESHDVEAIRQWRNAQIDVLRQEKPISREQQLRYYAREVWGQERLGSPSQILLVLTYDKDRTAYGGLTNIDWNVGRAELSFLTSPRRAQDPGVYGLEFGAFLELVVDGLAFVDLRLHRIWHETYDVRPYHVEVLENFGFVREGRLRDHAFIRGKWVDSLIYAKVSS